MVVSPSYAAVGPAQNYFLSDFNASTSFWNLSAQLNVVTSQCGVAVTVPACILRANIHRFAV